MPEQVEEQLEARRELERLVVLSEPRQRDAISADRLGLVVTYDGEPVDPARVVLYSRGGVHAQGEGAARVQERQTVPGEFLG